MSKRPSLADVQALQGKVKGKKPKAAKVKKPTEAQLQASCIMWFRTAWKPLVMSLFAIPNGGSRNAIDAVNMKRTGTLSGAWDLFLSVPSANRHGMYIEMKRDDKNAKLTPNQIAFQEANKAHYHFVVCRTIKEFQTAINSYLKS